MSILDLDPSTLAAGPWSGDSTWTVLSSGATVERVDAGGIPALHLASSVEGYPAEITATVTPPTDWTIHLVVAIEGAPASSSPGGYWSSTPLLCTTDGGWALASISTGPVVGRHLVTMTSAGALYLDGVLLGTWMAITLNAAVKLATYGGATHALMVSRLIVDDGVSATIDADMAALVAQYAGTSLGALGSWSVGGAGVLTVGEPLIPDLPVVAPGGSVTPPAPPEPQDPPAGVPPVAIRRHSEVMPGPTVTASSWPVDWTAASLVDEDYGRLQVVVEGVDVTYYLGVPIEFPSWSRTEPFGSSQATLRFPQITAFHVLPAWCVSGASVDIRFVRTEGGAIVSRFAGVVTAFGHSEDDGVFTITASGAVLADDLQLRQPGFLTAPRDIGDLIADVLNSTVSRRHDEITPVVTGCMSAVTGGWEPKVTGYVQELLATAITGGRQWTVRCDVRSPVLTLKDTDTVQWTVHNGQRGVKIDLAQDWSQATNVYYGEGIASDGGRWRNARYPNWHPDDTPAYPNANASKTIKVGTTDAGTDSGSGVSDWQRRVGVAVTGRFTLADRRKAVEVQSAAGIQRDGIVGPQTWAATFGTGSNTGTLNCFYMPLAYSPTVMPRLYGPDGDDLGANPAYNANALRVEEKIDFGQQVSKDEGIRAAGEMLTRSINPGWSGTVAFADVDPQELSRFEIQEGLNGRIRGFRGTDLIVHAAAVDVSEDSVSVTVDTNARDYPTLDAIRDRERNATDPAKSAITRLTQGSVTEARATFDAESPAGHVPRFALFSNLWSVVRIPFGSYGSIVRSEITTSSSIREFSVAVFSQPITAAGLLSLVGNPLTAESNPWSDAADELEAAGLLMSWGWYQQPAGYYPGEYSDPDGETESPLTGRMLDDASWDYASTQAPWLWVAVIATGSCYVEGRFWPGVD